MVQWQMKKNYSYSLHMVHTFSASRFICEAIYMNFIGAGPWWGISLQFSLLGCMTKAKNIQDRLIPLKIKITIMTVLGLDARKSAKKQRENMENNHDHDDNSHEFQGLLSQNHENNQSKSIKPCWHVNIMNMVNPLTFNDKHDKCGYAGQMPFVACSWRISHHAHVGCSPFLGIPNLITASTDKLSWIWIIMIMFWLHTALHRRPLTSS